MLCSDGSSRKVLDLFRLDERRALITGGSRGLGRIIAGALAEAGADVAIVSRTLSDCQKAADEIQASTGCRTMAIAADVTQASDVKRMAEELENTLGTIDILVNNAGINIRGTIDKVSENDWDTVIATNLKGPFLCSKRLGTKMSQRGWGRIINMGSIFSITAFPGRASYASSKAGLLNLTRVLALEWATKGVTVNTICPGPFATDMNKQILSDPVRYKTFVEKIPMLRWGELHEITGAAVFLASEAASYITGSALFIDGGWTAQ